MLNYTKNIIKELRILYPLENWELGDKNKYWNFFRIIGFNNFKFGVWWLTSVEERHCVIDKLQQSKVQIGTKYIKNGSFFFSFIYIVPSLRWCNKIFTEYFELSSINIFMEIKNCVCRYVFKITKNTDHFYKYRNKLM